MIYIIHFDEPLAHALHYVGWCPDGKGALSRRLKKHRDNMGARILQVCNERGISYQLARTLPGDRSRERQIKNTKNTSSYCPICRNLKRKSA